MDQRYDDIESQLLLRAARICSDLFPEGKLKGHHFTVGSINGESGKSLSVNMKTGLWKEFNGEDGQSGYLVKLYAIKKELSYLDAARELDRIYLSGDILPDDRFVSKAKIEQSQEITKPPKGRVPSGYHGKLGQPSEMFTYNDRDGEPMFWVARYPGEDGKKEIRPWSWDNKICKFTSRYWPAPRPLYNLDKIAGNPKAQVIVVEGEKTAEAAEKIINGVNAVVTTWSCGSSSWNKTDLSPLKNRHVLAWPDSDESGVNAMKALSDRLRMTTNTLKVLNVDKGGGGWDAADAFNEGWDLNRFRTFVAGNAVVINCETVNINNITTITAEAATSIGDSASKVSWNEIGIHVSKNGIPTTNADAGVLVLEHFTHLRNHIWYDTFHEKTMTDLHGEPNEIRDIDVNNFMIFCQRQLRLRSFSERTSHQSITHYAHTDIRCEPLDWMKTLKWDGKSRIQSFFTVAMGADDSEYTQAISKNFWISMVARVKEPGSKVDNMVILEGKQGKRKSSVLEVIGGKWFDDISEAVGTKDFFQSIQGVMLVEVSELASFSNRSSSKMKSVMSKRKDRFRASYGRHPEDYKRKCVFVGTTNESIYLKDATGNRRYWPVRVNNIDIDYTVKNRDQLFAEAYARLGEGERWYEVDPEAARKQQNIRTRRDSWESKVKNYLTCRSQVTEDEILTQCIQKDLSDTDTRDLIRIENILMRLGWMTTERNGERVWVPDAG